MNRIAMVVSMILTTQLCLAYEYKDPKGRYTITLPDGWTQISPEYIQAATKLANDSSVTYVTGFQPAGAAPMSYPYMLLQEWEGSSPSYSEIMRGLPQMSEVADVQDKLRDFGSNLDLQPSYDRANKIVWINLAMDVNGIGPVRGLSGIALGKEAMVALHAYTLKPNYEKQVGMFTDAVKSIKFPPGMEYDEASAEQSVWKRVMNGAGRGALIGAGVGLIIFAFARIFKK